MFLSLLLHPAPQYCPGIPGNQRPNSPDSLQTRQQQFSRLKAARKAVLIAGREIPSDSAKIRRCAPTSTLIRSFNGGSVATSGPTSNSASSPLQQGSSDQPSPATNVAAITGAVISGFSVILYAFLFYLVSGLPAQQPELSLLQDNTPALLRLTLAGSSAVLLNIVALALAVLALILPGRSRLLAWIVVLISAVLLLSVASVILLSVMM